MKRIHMPYPRTNHLICVSDIGVSEIKRVPLQCGARRHVVATREFIHKVWHVLIKPQKVERRQTVPQSGYHAE